jgi:hypothetical protein
MLRISNLNIKLYDTVMTRAWLKLYLNLNINPDLIIDNSGISNETFTNDIQEANKKFGFDWPTNPTTQNEYNQMHKDIETAPKHKADLLQSIHNHLHVREAGDNGASQIQFCWTESLGQFYKKKPVLIDMPEDAEPFSKKLKYGDVFLGFPHIGKSPEVCMLQNDNSNLPQTCRLHNKIVCDILISLVDRICDTDEQLLSWHGTNEITMFTKEKMLKYNGWAIIGEVINKDDIVNIDRKNLRMTYAKD